MIKKNELDRAEEYDAAQERGEVVGAHNGALKRVGDDNAIIRSSDLGVRRDEIHEATIERAAKLESLLRMVSLAMEGEQIAGAGQFEKSGGGAVLDMAADMAGQIVEGLESRVTS